MTTPNMRLLPAIIALVSASAVFTLTLTAGASRNAGQDRLVTDVSRSDAPVKISLIKTKRKTIESGKKFDDDENWLRGFTIRVVNRSAKTVTYVGIEIYFLRIADQLQGLPAGWPLDYGFNPFVLSPGQPVPTRLVAPIAPGAEAEIALSDSEYDQLNDFLSQVSFPNSRRKVEVEVKVKVVGFDDDTAWNFGHLLRRDSGGAFGPLKGWSLIRGPVGERLTPRSSKGSADTRTAFFVAAALDIRLNRSCL